MSGVGDVRNIGGYHAHVYFDAVTLEQDQALCESAAGFFDVEVQR